MRENIDVHNRLQEDLRLLLLLNAALCCQKYSGALSLRDEK